MVENLISQSSHRIKGLPRSHRIDEHISMYTNKMLGIHYTVFILFTKVRDKSENGGSALQQAALGIETKEGSRNRDDNWDRVGTLLAWLTWPAVSTISVAKS